MLVRHRIARAAGALLACAAAATPADALVAAPGAPLAQAEQTNIRLVSKSLRVVKPRRVPVRLRCTTEATCTGLLGLRIGNGGTQPRPPGKRYRVEGRTTATILVGITPTAKRKIVGTNTPATVKLTERGPNGERSVEKVLRIRLGADVM